MSSCTWHIVVNALPCAWHNVVKPMVKPMALRHYAMHTNHPGVILLPWCNIDRSVVQTCLVIQQKLRIHWGTDVNQRGNLLCPHYLQGICIKGFHPCLYLCDITRRYYSQSSSQDHNVFRGGAQGGGRLGCPLWFSFSFLFVCWSAQRLVMYVGRESPPPPPPMLSDFFRAAAASKHFAAPNQHPAWRRPGCMLTTQRLSVEKPFTTFYHSSHPGFVLKVSSL